MLVKVNNQAIDIESPFHLQQLLTQLGQSDKGVALAVNQRVISRSEWSEYVLHEGDSITLISA